MDSEIAFAAIETSQHRSYDIFRMQPFLRVQHRCEPRFEINNAVVMHIFDVLVSDALERVFGLHNAARVLKALEIEWQTSPVRVPLKPFGEFEGIRCGEPIISRLVRELDDCAWAQTPIQVIVKQDLRHFPQ